MGGFVSVEKDFKKHANRVSHKQIRQVNVAADPDGTRAKESERKNVSRQKQVAADPEGVRAKHREEENVSRQKRFAADPDGVRKYGREKENVSRQKKFAADPEGTRAKERERKQHSLVQQEQMDPVGFTNKKWNAAKQNFLKEIRFGPFFVCECCNTQHFFHNVVKKTPVLIRQIRSSAKDASIREYNSKLEQVI